MELTKVTDKWFSLASDLRNRCLSLVIETPLQAACSLEESPNLFAALLFCGTITNFKGAIILLQQDLIIEAQMLQRSCFENSLWLGTILNFVRCGYNLLEEEPAHEH